MLWEVLPKFKVVEINNVASLRMGHLIGQTPAYVATKSGVTKTVACKTVDTNYKFVENGIIVGLDQENVLANFDVARHAQPCLVYTEELRTSGLLSGLNQYAEAVPYTVSGGVYTYGPVYVRALPLEVGDTFTTDNFSGAFSGSAKEGFAKVVNGIIVLEDSKSDNSLFVAKMTNLPAGQVAVELHYFGLVVSGSGVTMEQVNEAIAAIPASGVTMEQVNTAIADIPAELPAYSSADVGKTLKVTAEGTLEWSV